MRELSTGLLTELLLLQRLCHLPGRFAAQQVDLVCQRLKLVLLMPQIAAHLEDQLDELAHRRCRQNKRRRRAVARLRRLVRLRVCDKLRNREVGRLVCGPPRSASDCWQPGRGGLHIALTLYLLWSACRSRRLHKS